MRSVSVHSAKRPRSRSRANFERGCAGVVTGFGGLLHEAEVVGDIVQHFGSGDGAVAGDDGFGAEGADAVEGVEPAGDGAHQGEGGAFVEDDIAGDDEFAFGQPDDCVGVGVGGGDVDELQFEFTGVEREAVFEGYGGGDGFDCAPLDGGEHLAGAVGQLGSVVEDFGAAVGVADDHGVLGEEVVAEGVVEVGVGVDQGAHGLCGDVGDSVAEEAGAALGGAGVDGDYLVASCYEGGVIEAPGAVVLDVGEDAGGDFDDFGIGELGVGGDLFGAHCGFLTRFPHSVSAALAVSR